MANPQKENGHTAIANELLHAFMWLRINGTQFRLLCVILRKTYGWHKKEDPISLSQFNKLTGLPRALISRELLDLEKRKVIMSQSHTGKTKIYSLQKDYEKWDNYLPISRQLIRGLSTNQSTTIYQSVDELSTNQSTTKEIKETIQKKEDSFKHFCILKTQIIQLADQYHGDRASIKQRLFKDGYSEEQIEEHLVKYQEFIAQYELSGK